MLLFDGSYRERNFNAELNVLVNNEWDLMPRETKKVSSSLSILVFFFKKSAYLQKYQSVFRSIHRVAEKSSLAFVTDEKVFDTLEFMRGNEMFPFSPTSLAAQAKACVAFVAAIETRNHAVRCFFLPSSF